MVRVFSTYHYLGQDVHIINDDILTSCLLDDNHLILAKLNHIIEIRPIQHSDVIQCNPEDVNHNTKDVYYEIPQQHQEISQFPSNNKSISDSLVFPTVDQVKKLEYCKNG